MTVKEDVDVGIFPQYVENKLQTLGVGRERGRECMLLIFSVISLPMTGSDQDPPDLGLFKILLSILSESQDHPGLDSEQGG